MYNKNLDLKLSKMYDYDQFYKKHYIYNQENIVLNLLEF